MVKNCDMKRRISITIKIFDFLTKMLKNLDENENLNAQKEHNLRFQIHRISLYILLSLSYAICLFFRSCPSMVADKMAEDYGVDKSDIGIFTSIYFYTYAIIQPFVGLLVDVTEPAYIIGFSLLIGSIGNFVCGAGKSMLVGCIARAFVGIGCGPVYVSVNRCLVNWFEVHSYAFVLGIVHAIGSLGYLVAQGPLASMADHFGWRKSFYSVGIFGVIIGILVLIFVRGNPVVYHYKPVNKDLDKNAPDIPFKEKLHILLSNIKTVVVSIPLWLCIWYSILTNGPFYVINGMWGTQYLEDVLEYSAQKAGNAMMVLTIVGIIGNVIVPPICYLFKTRKWVLAFSALIIGSVTLVFIFLNKDKMTLIIVCVVFSIYALFGSTCSIIYSLGVDFFNPKLAGAVIGLMNLFLFLVSAIFLAISSKILNHYGTIPGTSKYTFEGYKMGLWVVCIICYALAFLVVLFVPEKKFVKEKEEEAPIIENSPQPLLSVNGKNEPIFTD